MPFLRITNLSQLPKEYGLKEVQPCPTFKQARRIAREAYQVIYYFKRRGFPPLLMEKKARILEHEYSGGTCIHCGQAEPKPEDQPTASASPTGQGNAPVTLPDPDPIPLPPIDPRLLEVGAQLTFNLFEPE